jgi:hypothetical protein
VRIKFGITGIMWNGYFHDFSLFVQQKSEEKTVKKKIMLCYDVEVVLFCTPKNLIGFLI